MDQFIRNYENFPKPGSKMNKINRDDNWKILNLIDGHMGDGFLWLHRCWWRMLETKCAGDKVEMLVTDLIHWKITNITKKVGNIMILPTSQIGHHHKVTNITRSPTSLSPYEHLDFSWIDFSCSDIKVYKICINYINVGGNLFWQGIERRSPTCRM